MIGVPSGATDPKDSMFAAIGQFSAVSIISPNVSCITRCLKNIAIGHVAVKGLYLLRLPDILFSVRIYGPIVRI
jgi:hypothetical protein